MDTSVAALGAVEGGGRAADLKREIIIALRKNRNEGFDGLTTDEAAMWMGESVLSIRPRFTELKKAGIIVDTGNRRRNASGKNAAVWTLVGYESSIGGQNVAAGSTPWVL